MSDMVFLHGKEMSIKDCVDEIGNLEYTNRNLKGEINHLKADNDKLKEKISELEAELSKEKELVRYLCSTSPTDHIFKLVIGDRIVSYSGEEIEAILREYEERKVLKCHDIELREDEIEKIRNHPLKDVYKDDLLTRIENLEKTVDILVEEKKKELINDIYKTSRERQEMKMYEMVFK